LEGPKSDNFTYIWSIDGQPSEAGSKADILPGMGVDMVILIAYDVLGNRKQASRMVTVLLLNGIYLPAIQK